ncbi:MAG: hypothetical protein B7Y31_13345, partial [Novosphingobium sp. 16-62-11]
MRQAGEPSVEEILESIKSVIARDSKVEAQARLRSESRFDSKPTPRREVLELTETAEHDDTEDEAESGGLIADAAAASMRESLAALSMLAQPGAAPQIVRSGETSLEGLVRELLARKSGQSIGIVAFSEAQQSEIEDALERLAAQDEAFAAALTREVEREDDGQFNGLFVKNLENVQGDERDVILFSIAFWKDASGKSPPMTFGALNRDGGERRLNVAVTRARQELIVFSGFTADQIDASRSKYVAVHHLKTFLDYA